MVIVWMSICLSQFNFRRQWYRSGHTVKDLQYAAPLFPIVPILGFVFCFITCLSMAADPEMRAGFVGCLIFTALCYVSYFIFIAIKAKRVVIQLKCSKSYTFLPIYWF